VKKAFVLGAGLGTRLKSLTEFLPKPLIPVYQRPLISFAFDHLQRAGLGEFVVNTHHCAEAYAEHFPDSSYNGAPITFRHEPVLLETGGGIDNVADLLAGDTFVVYNGDILTDLPLEEAFAAHRGSGNDVTLVLRSAGPALHIALDRASGKVVDIRNKLGTGNEGEFQFTGIYICEPGFLDRLWHGQKHSVIHIFLELIRDGGKLGGVVVDGGNWWDLGCRETYIEAHLAIAGTDFPIYDASPSPAWKVALHETAEISASARINAGSCVGARAKIGDGAELRGTLVWDGGEVAAGAKLDYCIVRSGQVASGNLDHENI
jgi:mannose-1-phosphate guanylyltransferase/mannose-1-phosphate guanylyltransferase/phosphomannomutase